jgi:hypothetical protein
MVKTTPPDLFVIFDDQSTIVARKTQNRSAKEKSSGWVSEKNDWTGLVMP